MMAGKEYKSINKIEDYMFSPWKEPVLLDGTDGMQFSPDLQKDSKLKAFVNDLSRNCYFDFSHVDDRFPHLDTYIYNIEEALMLNKYDYPPNENFDVRVTGTTNMTSSLNAYAFAAKGHYYQMDPAVNASIPTIVDQNEEEIVPNSDDDDTYLGVERYSGVCLIAMERIFFNMAIYGDDLFKDMGIPGDDGWFFPLSFVKRESVWTQDQVDDVFGALVTGQKVKWGLFSVLMILGLGFLALTVFCGFRSYKMHKELYPGKNFIFHVDVEDESLTPLDATGENEPTPRMGANGNAAMRTESSDSDFSKSRPLMQQEDRPFSLVGQGKPLPGTNSYDIGATKSSNATPVASAGILDDNKDDF
jgi:hypothetical protein|mmetsp:Transcript_46943/g.62148  ORF Transcript_46943/g.62148 Transcript_46943/m.62148 type:complete len:360 (+) Transcript_46943:1275-2354(+)